MPETSTSPGSVAFAVASAQYLIFWWRWCKPWVSFAIRPWTHSCGSSGRRLLVGERSQWNGRCHPVEDEIRTRPLPSNALTTSRPEAL